MDIVKCQPTFITKDQLYTRFFNSINVKNQSFRVLGTLMLLLIFSASAFGQIEYEDACFTGLAGGNGVLTLSPNGTTNDGQIRNTFDTGAVDNLDSDGDDVTGVGEVQIIWSSAPPEWQILVDSDFNGTFETVLRTNPNASYPNPPDLTLGGWVDQQAGACGTNITAVSGDVQSTVAPCAAPTAQATAPTFGVETETTLNLTGWTAPAGGATGYVVIMNTSATFTPPTDGTSPVANSVYGGGQQVVYNSTSEAANLTVTGLTASTTYFFRIYSYNDCTGTETYETTGLSTSDVTAAACAAPTAQATAATFGTETTTTLNLTSWTAPVGGATGYVVIMNTAASFTTPTDGTSPVANTVYGGGEQVIYNGTSAAPNVTVTGLSPHTTYHFRVYSYNDCTGTETYEGTGLDASDVTANTVPTAADFTAVAAVDEVITIATADFGYNDGDGDSFTSIELVTIPGAGTLFLDLNDNGVDDGGGETLAATDVITVANLDLNRLKYQGASAGGNTTFTFTVNDGFDDSTPANTATLYSVENALDFDGVDDVVDAGLDASLQFDNTDAFTIEAWVYKTTSGQQAIVSNFAVNTGYVFFINASDFLRVRLSETAGSFIDVQGNTAVSLNTWHHVTLTYDGSSDASGVTFYLDGVEQVNTVNQNTLAGSTISGANVTIGESQLGGVSNFVGQIDEVRMWSAARLPAQIRANAASRLSNPSAIGSLVLYYDFNSGIPAGDNTGLVTAVDLSSSGNNGTLNNFDVDGTNTGGTVSNWVASTAFASTAATTSNMVVTESTTTYFDGVTTYDFGTQTLASNTDVTFTITNQGLADLNLTAAPSLNDGTNYSIQSGYGAATILTPGQTQSMTVRYTPTTAAVHPDYVIMASNDAATDPYHLNLTGTGQALVAITVATWLDSDFDGDIDQLQLDFSETVDITDGGAGADGFPAIVISGGAITIDNVDLSGAGFDAVTTLTLNVSGATGTADPGVTVTYDEIAGPGNTVASIVGSQEIVDGAAAQSYVDGAAPVVIDAWTVDADADGFIDGVELEFSESMDDDNASGDLSLLDVLTYAGDTPDALNDDDQFLTVSFTEDIAPNYDTDATPNVDIPAGAVADATGNVRGAIQNFTATLDAAGPAIISALTDDIDGDGHIDQLTITFSENIDDGTSDISPTGIDVTGYANEAPHSTNYTDDDDDTIVIEFDELAGFDTGVTPDIDLLASGIVDADGNAAVQTFTGTTDGADPIIASLTMAAANAYADITFSEGIYSGGGGPLQDTDLTVTVGGTAQANFTGILALTQNDNTDQAAATALAGGETVVRMFFTYSNGSLTTDILIVDPFDGTSIEDGASSPNNAPSPLPGTLNEDNFFVSTVPTFSAAELHDTDANGYIDRLEIYFGSFNININEDNDLRGADGLSCIEITYNGNVIDQVAFNYDNDNINSGTALVINLDPADLDIPAYTGSQNWQVEYVFEDHDTDGFNTQITSGGAQMDFGSLAPMVDKAAPYFPHFTATVLDDDSDGSVDRIEVYTADEIDDSTVDGLDFTYNGVQASAVALDQNNTDQIFTLGVSNGTATIPEGDFVFAGASTGSFDDANANTITASSQTILQASVIDGAPPVVLSATTGEDASPDGVLDFIELELSEDVSGAGVIGDYDVVGVNETSTALNGTNFIRVFIDGALPTTATPGITISDAAFSDLAANDFVGPDVIGATDDGAAPFAQIADDGTNTTYASYPRTYGSLSVTIDGRVDDVGALVFVEVDGNGNLATVDAGGLWSVNTSVSDQGTYDVSVTTFDSNGNIGNDTTTDEISITGGVTISAADAPSLVCENSDYVVLNDLIITETDPANFAVQSNKTILLSLPDDFFFDTSVIPGIAVAGGSEVTISTDYIGTAILRINVDVSGIVETNTVTISGLSVTSVGDGIGASVDMTRFGGDAVVFGASTNGQIFGTMQDAPTPADLTSVDVIVGTPVANITEYASRVGEPITFDADDALNTVNWFDYDGNLVFQGATPTESSLATQIDAFTPTGYFDNTVAGLYTFYVEDDNGSCQSNQLKVNILIYDDDDFDSPGSPSFVTRTYNVTDAADNIYISNPVGHNVAISSDGSGFQTTSTGDPLIAEFDPGVAGIQSSPGHIITYEIRNLTSGETFELVRELTVQAAATLFDNGPLDYYCDDDGAVTFSLDGSQFNATYGALPYIQYMEGHGLRHLGQIYNIEGQDLHDGTNVNGTNPPLITTNYEFDFDPSLFSPPAGDFEHVYFYTVIEDADGVKRIGAEDYFIVYGEADLDLSNVSDGQSFCSNESSFTIQRNLQYVNTMDFSDPASPVATYFTQTNQNITTGYQLYYSPDGVAPYTLLANFTGGNLNNDFDPNDPDQDGTTYKDDPVGESDNIGFYRLDYTTGAVGPNSCETTISKFVEVQLQPDMLELDEDPITLFGGVLSIQNTDEYLLEACQGSSMPTVNVLGASYSFGISGYTSASPVASNQFVYVTRTAALDPDQNGVIDGGYSIITQGYATGDTISLGVSGQSAAFTVNEILQGQTSGARVYVTSDPFAGTVSVRYYNGTQLQLGEVVQGLSSGNTATLNTITPNTSMAFNSIDGSLVQVGDYLNFYQDGVYRYAQVTSISAPSTDITWYNASQVVIAGYEDTPIIPSSQLGINTNTSGTLSAEQIGLIFYYSTTAANGCESELRKVTVNIYGRADAPELDLAATAFDEDDVRSGSTSFYEYDLDYCTATTGGTDAVPDQLVLPALSGGDEYLIYKYFKSDFISDPNVNTGYVYQNQATYATNTIDISADALANGQSYRYIIYLRDNINGVTGFNGCQSSSTYVRTYGYDIPSVPTAADFTDGATDFHVAEGDVLDPIFHANVGMDEYYWYEENNRAAQIGDELNSGEAMSVNTLKGLATPGKQFLVNASNESLDAGDDAVNDVYTYYVSRLDNIVAANNFPGCESTTNATVTITVHPKQAAPSIVSDNAAGTLGQPAVFPDINKDGDGGNDDGTVEYYYAVCLDQVEGTLLFTSSQGIFGYYTNLSGTFQAGEMITGGTSGATAYVSSDDGAELMLRDVTGSFSPTEQIAGATSTATADLNSTHSYAGSSSRYEWYAHNGTNRTSAVPLFTGVSPTFVDLQIGSISAAANKFFEVVQVTDDDVFAGTESEPTLIRIEFFDQDDLTFTAIGDGDDICQDDLGDGSGTIQLALESDGIAATASLLTYSVVSSPTDFSDAIILDDDGADGDGFGNPEIDIAGWHTAAGGTTVGGVSTTHTITMTYIQANGGCEITNTATITIHPDPDISFTVAGVDINDVNFATLYDEFCYEDGLVGLQGTLSDGTPLTGGAFTSSATGALTTANGFAQLNPQSEHNAFHSVAGTAGEYLNQSTTTITYTYTDGFGCQNSVNVPLYINPEPEVFDVERYQATPGDNDLPTSDLAAGRTTNYIRLTNFCSDATTANAEIRFVDPTEEDDPTDTDRLDDEEGDYSLYTFEWTINGQPTPDADLNGLPDPQTGVNTIAFTPAANNINISVVVTDGSGCAETFTETHTLQVLPSLDIVGIVDNQQFCVGTAASIVPVVSDATLDGDGAANTVDQSLLTWYVESYTSTDGTLRLIDSGTGALPTINDAQLLTWHNDVNLASTGVDESDGIGGPITSHLITVDYTDPSREYQGVATSCFASRNETIVVNPLPEIDFTVAGFGGAYTGETGSVAADAGYSEYFCYDNGTVNLIGITRNLDGTVGSLPAGVGSFSTTGGVTNTGNALATWSPILANGSDPHALNTAGIDITFTFTDANGCQSMVTKTLFVDPLPDPIEVTGDEITFDQICADGDIIARVPLLDPATGTEVGTGGSLLSYSDFTFDWTSNTPGGGSIGALDAVVGQTDNQITFTSRINNGAADYEFDIAVLITDNSTGCSWLVEETHEIQELPTLDYSTLTDISDAEIDASDFSGADIYCWEDGTQDLALFTNAGEIGVAASTDIGQLNYQIDSYVMSNGAIVRASPDATISSGGNPTLDFDVLHGSVGGVEIGGDTTVHVVTMTYTDVNDNQYQGQFTNCLSVNTTAFVIYPRPDITFAYEADLDGLINDDPDLLEVCYDDASFELQGLLSDLSEIDGNGTGNFTISNGQGVGNTNSSNVTLFDPSDAHDGFHGTGAGAARFLAQSTNVVTFDYVDDYGCSHAVSKTILVNPSPEVEGATGDKIVYDAICLGYPIEAHVVIYEPGTTNEVASYAGYSFDWTINSSTNQVVGDDNYVIFPSQPDNLSVNMTVIVTSPDGCQTTVTETDSQGFPPVPSFTYVGITANSADGLEFEFQENNPLLADGDVDTLAFEIRTLPGDVLVASEYRTGNDLSPLNLKTDLGVDLDSGQYEARVWMGTPEGCLIPDSARVITILPLKVLGDPITGGGYVEDFEGASADPKYLGDWYIEVASEDGKNDTTRNVSWKRMTLASTGTYNDDIISDGRGNIVVTNAPEGMTSYYSSEVSFVYSPAMDLTQYTNPAIKFDHIRDFESTRDGLVVQVSDDDGRSWTTLGDNDINSGIEWYTHQGIASAPGNNVGRSPETGTTPQLVGFADVDRDEFDAATPIWKESRHQITTEDVDFENQPIRFRFALGASAGDKFGGDINASSDGFAFDNFELYEINKLMVVEQFSSTLSAESKAYEDFLINGDVDNDPINWEQGNQGVLINYHTDMLNEGSVVDPLNARNKVDPSTRATFYGVKDVPDTRIAGTDVPYDLDNVPEDFGNGFNALALNDADFNINKDHPSEPDDIVLNASDADVLSVSTTFRSLADVSEDVELGFFFAIVEKQKTGITSGAYGPTDVISYPLRVMLPGPEGYYYRGPIASGQEFTYDIDWTISGIDDPNEIRVICFVQYYDHPNPNKVGSIEQAAWIDIDGEGKTNSVVGLEDLLTDDVLTLYPNPADDRVTMKLADAPMKPVMWRISDQSGKQVMIGRIERGIKEVTIDTDQLPSGMYIIQIFNDQNSWVPKKVIISH